MKRCILALAFVWLSWECKLAPVCTNKEIHDPWSGAILRTEKKCEPCVTYRMKRFATRKDARAFALTAPSNVSAFMYEEGDEFGPTYKPDKEFNFYALSINGKLCRHQSEVCHVVSE
jgi:hypothetical protein